MSWRIVWLVMWCCVYLTGTVSTGIFIFMGLLPWIVTVMAILILVGGTYWIEQADKWEREKQDNHQP